VQHLFAAWENGDSSDVEFTGAELAGGAELAAPVEKIATGPVEKAVVVHSGGYGGREAWWRGRARWRGRRSGEKAAWEAWQIRRAGCATERGRGLMTLW
jgi:hypothetical protein